MDMSKYLGLFVSEASEHLESLGRELVALEKEKTSERVDAMFAARACPDAIVVFVDAWTSRGGSQFINSASIGRYLDYLCDEVVPFIDGQYPTLASEWADPQARKWNLWGYVDA